jgi:hypothetical protein
MEAVARNQQALDQEQIDLSVAAGSNPLANVWLFILATLLGGTLLCTTVLVAWPIIAKLVAG